MKKIAVDILKPGLIFTEPVYIEGDNVLVPAGVPLRQKDIEQLKSWDIATVETEGEVRIPSAESTAAAAAAKVNEKTDISPAVQGAKNAPNLISLSEVQENKGAYRDYRGLIEKLNVVFNSIADGISVEARSIDNLTTMLLQDIREQRDSFIGFILGGEVSGRELAKSSINTAILSALIAHELKLANHKILHIVTAALLHDVGMLRLPREIMNKKGGLSEAELKQVKSHPIYTHKIVVRELSYPEDVGLIVLQHHERWDGGGYPRRTANTAIDLGARIVSVADAFEAMVSKKPYRTSMVGYQAMKNLMSDNHRRFDPNVLKAFILIMGIYPIGSLVLMNTGAMARVIEVQGDAPLRPKIQLLVNEYGRVFKPEKTEIIDLAAEKTLFIARAVDPKEFAKRNV